MCYSYNVLQTHQKSPSHTTKDCPWRMVDYGNPQWDWVLFSAMPLLSWRPSTSSEFSIPQYNLIQKDTHLKNHSSYSSPPSKKPWAHCSFPQFQCDTLLRMHINCQISYHVSSCRTSQWLSCPRHHLLSNMSCLSQSWSAWSTLQIIFPVTLQIPMLCSRRKAIALSMVVLHLNFCDTVHWIFLDIVLCSMTAFGLILPLCFFLKVRWKWLFACYSDRPGFNYCILEVKPAVARPSFSLPALISVRQINSE